MINHIKDAFLSEFSLKNCIHIQKYGEQQSHTAQEQEYVARCGWYVGLVLL